jgi:hypothetical protein
VDIDLSSVCIVGIGLSGVGPRVNAPCGPCIIDYDSPSGGREIQKKAGTLMNWHTSDIGWFFRDVFNMDLTAENIDEYNAANLMDFDRLVGDHGWSAMLGQASCRMRRTVSG